MKENKKIINFTSKIKPHIFNIIFKLIIIFFYFPFSLSNEISKILYIKTNGIIEVIKIIDKENISIINGTQLDNYFENDYKRVEVYGQEIIINILKNENNTKIYFGILLQIGNNFYELNDSNIKVLSDVEMTCEENIGIYCNHTYIKNITYCYINNTDKIYINISMPFDKNETIYNETSSDCFQTGKESNDTYLICNNTKGYYLKENDNNSSMCYNNTTIEEGYYLDINESIFKKCHHRCRSCTERGDDSNTKCLYCTSDYHFHPNTSNHCINISELSNTNYYIDENDTYQLCHESCLECNGPFNNSCTKCDNSYYLKENDNISSMCYNYSSIGEGYFLDDSGSIFKKCHHRCRSCTERGDDSNTKCLNCTSDYHFDPNKSNHCTNLSELSNTNYYIDENDTYQLCHESCLECNGPFNNSCTKCDNNNSYYLKENDNNSSMCYNNNTIEKGYYLDINESIFKKCHHRCSSCKERGDDSNTKCLNCISAYHFHPNTSNHCINISELSNTNYYIDENNTYQLCHELCLECNGPFNNSCIKCDNNNSYYLKENNNNSSMCYNNNTIDEGYYLDINESIFKKCHHRCNSCKEGGDDSNTKCLICISAYHFHPDKSNHCTNLNELPQDSNYYIDENDTYQLCPKSCSKCENLTYCSECNEGYYYKENDTNKICYSNITIGDGYYLYNNSLFKKCYFNCKNCYGAGNNSTNNCSECNNNEEYHFDPLINNKCIKFEQLPNSSFYVDKDSDKYKICHESCLTCDGPNNDNCNSCNGINFFEVDKFQNKCLTFSEIPKNFYSIQKLGIYTYYSCHISCKICLVDGPNNCLQCNIKGGYYPRVDKIGSCLSEKDIPHKYYLDKDNNIINKCYDNCDSCSKGFNNVTKEMNCDSCINGTYFQNISSTNCIPRPNTSYYIDLYKDKKTLFPCHKNCLKCDIGGNDTNNECIECNKELYPDDEIITNCVDDDNKCGIGCAKCFKNRNISNYGIIPSEQMCKRCSHKMGYYPLEKETDDQFYVFCYPKGNPPKYYFFDEIDKKHKQCYRTCEKCNQTGNYSNHSCSTCDNNYVSIEEKPFNCFPKCNYYYYYTKYNQYKCTENLECPLDYPYLILSKKKCIDNCYNDKEFNFTFKNECLEKCPEGTYPYFYKYNGEDTAKCIDSNENLDESECKLNIKNNNNLEYNKITEDILQEYAEEYVREYPLANTYVTSYSYADSSHKYLIILYKLEKCPKEKVEGYVSIDFDECIKKAKTANNITQNIVIEIFYIIKKSSIPQINYYLYHPDTGKKIDLSVCSGEKLSIKSSIFDNEEVDEELVKYFTNLNINIFDINDPFFTDICFNFSKDGKDVPLDDRIQLYFLNISLCEDGCTNKGINFETFEVECSCDVHISENKKISDITKTFFDNPISNEVFGFIKDSNLEVLTCIKNAFNIKLIINNYGGMAMIGIYFTQIILTVFIKIQNAQVRSYIYSLINESNFPPKKKKDLDIIMNNSENNNKDINNIYKDFIFFDIPSTEPNENNKKLNNSDKQIKTNLEKNINSNNINIFHNKNQLIQPDTLNSQSTNRGLYKRDSYIKKPPLKYDIVETVLINKERNKGRYFSFKREKALISEEQQKNNKKSREKNEIKIIDIKDLKKDIIMEIKKEKEAKEKFEKRQKEIFVSYEPKDYNEKEINELDFEEAIIYDKRNFCQIFWSTLKEKQTIINTFCTKEPVKPFSSKLLVMIFSFTCYFVINGFLYNEEYVSKKLTQESKTLYEFITDSIGRILYSSIVGGLISFIIEILFNTEKKIENLQKKYKDNKILLKGEIAKLFRCSNIITISFIIVQFILMTFFTIYIFCFNYVYPNNMLDWLESSLIILFIIQSFSLLTSFLISILKYLSVKFHWKLCFLINEYLNDNL